MINDKELLKVHRQIVQLQEQLQSWLLKDQYALDDGTHSQEIMVEETWGLVRNYTFLLEEA